MLYALQFFKGFELFFSDATSHSGGIVEIEYSIFSGAELYPLVLGGKKAIAP